jgi:hypothetical protein
VYSIDSSENDDANGEQNDPTGTPILPPSVPELRRMNSTSSNISTVNYPDPLAEFYAQAKAEHETGVSCLFYEMALYALTS